MTIEAPITLIKTRVEKIGSSNIMVELRYILSNPSKGVIKGLGSTLAREGIYTFFHYNTFRYLKDSVFKKDLGVETTFIPAFIAGVVAITASQPLEVIRSQLSLNFTRESINVILARHFQ